MLLSIYIFELCHVEKTKINKKEAGMGPFFKKCITFLIISVQVQFVFSILGSNPAKQLLLTYHILLIVRHLHLLGMSLGDLAIRTERGAPYRRFK